MTAQQILDAIASVELHHFRGTATVACCLLDQQGRAHIGIASALADEEPNLTTISERARAAAEQVLANTHTMKGDSDGNH